MSKRYIARLMEQIEAIPSLVLVHVYLEPVLSQHPVSNLRPSTKCEPCRQTPSIRSSVNITLRVQSFDL